MVEQNHSVGQTVQKHQYRKLQCVSEHERKAQNTISQEILAVIKFGSSAPNLLYKILVEFKLGSGVSALFIKIIIVSCLKYLNKAMSLQI